MTSGHEYKKFTFHYRTPAIYRRRIAIQIAICLCVFSVVFVAKPVHADLSEYYQLNCGINVTRHSTPSYYMLFDDVDRVIIVFQNLTSKRNLQQYKIPSVLSKSNIKKTAKKIYQLRYRKLDIEEHYDPGCYGRANQPVKTLPFATEEQREKAREQSLKKGTLTVFITLKILSSEKATLNVVNYRPHLNQSWWRDWLDMPVPFWDVEIKASDFSLNQKPQRLQTIIENIIASRVR